MIKHFCDICGNEITNERFSINVGAVFGFCIERDCGEENVNLADHKDYEICGNCYGKIEQFANGLKLKKE